MIKKIVVDVPGYRLDKYLSLCLTDFSRVKIQNLVKSGKVSRDGLPFIKTSHIVSLGEEFFIDLNPPIIAFSDKNIHKFSDFTLDILYEDEWLAVINKPSGMVTHSGFGTKNDTLVNELVKCYGLNLSSYCTNRPGIVHRLDKETSGVIVIAKTDLVHNFLSKIIEERKLSRKYIGIVWGHLGDQGIIEANIVKHRSNKMMAISNYKGKVAITKYKTMSVMSGKYGIGSVVEFKLETGRTHQIRVHSMYKKCPIVGDKIYGRKISCEQDLILRHALHACEIKFKHPISGKSILVSSDIPCDIKLLIKKFSNYV